MQEECLKASFRINRLNLHDAANPRVGCGMFELSSNETQLMLGRSNDMFKHEPSISRKHLQLTLQKDGTVEAVRMGQQSISLRDRKNQFLSALLPATPITIYKGEILLLATSRGTEYEIEFESLVYKSGSESRLILNRPIALRPPPFLQFRGSPSRAPSFGSLPPTSVNSSPTQSQIFTNVIDDDDSEPDFAFKRQPDKSSKRKRAVVDLVDDMMDVDDTPSIAAPPPPPTRIKLADQQTQNHTDYANFGRLLVSAALSKSEPAPASASASASPPTTSAISQLQEMFPERSTALLQKAITVFAGVESVTDFLLARSNSSDATILQQLGIFLNEPAPGAAAGFGRADPFLHRRMHPSISSVGNKVDSSTASTATPPPPLPPPAAAVKPSKPTTPTATSSVVPQPRTQWDELVRKYPSLPPEVTSFVGDLLSTIAERDTQLNQVTGGFSFEVWSRMQRKKMESSAVLAKVEMTLDGDDDDSGKSECVVCMDASELAPSACGCSVLCMTCLPRLIEKNHACPQCHGTLANLAPPKAAKTAKRPRVPFPAPTIVYETRLRKAKVNK